MDILNASVYHRMDSSWKGGTERKNSSRSMKDVIRVLLMTTLLSFANPTDANVSLMQKQEAN